MTNVGQEAMSSVVLTAETAAQDRERLVQELNYLQQEYARIGNAIVTQQGAIRYIDFAVERMLAEQPVEEVPAEEVPELPQAQPPGV